MKQIYTFLIAILSISLSVNAQTEVTVDGSAEWVGFANVSELPENGGAYVFGESWGVPDLKSTIGTSDNTVTIQPNFNTYGDGTDPFWVNQSTGEGNKTFEGNTFIEDASLVGSEVTFTGSVTSNTLDSDYEAMAFIKVFNADFSVLKIEEAALVEGEEFVIEYTNVEGTDAVVQYGFYVRGPNANPDDEDALGSIVIAENVLSVNDFDAVQVSAYPNPTTNGWTIEANNQVITSIEVFDIAGKRVVSQRPDSTEATIETANLKSGIYIATIVTPQGETTTKLIKK